MPQVRLRRHPPLAPSVLACGLVVGALVAGCSAAAPAGPPADADRAVVRHIVDGDTIDVAIGGRRERIRLIGIDTPETVAPGRRVQCFGREASEYLVSLLPPGTQVRLERDIVARDRYGRLLAYVHRAEDDLFINLVLVEQGYADAVSFGDNVAVWDRLVAAKAAARTENLGLWGACGGPDVDIGPPSTR